MCIHVHRHSHNNEDVSDCPPDLPSFEDQYKAAARTVFDRGFRLMLTILLYFLPHPCIGLYAPTINTAASQIYTMRTRPHNKQLPCTPTHAMGIYRAHAGLKFQSSPTWHLVTLLTYTLSNIFFIMNTVANIQLLLTSVPSDE